jgi:hypothetical protein
MKLLLQKKVKAENDAKLLPEDIDKNNYHLQQLENSN